MTVAGACPAGGTRGYTLARGSIRHAGHACPGGRTGAGGHRRGPGPEHRQRRRRVHARRPGRRRGLGGRRAPDPLAVPGRRGRPPRSSSGPRAPRPTPPGPSPTGSAPARARTRPGRPSRRGRSRSGRSSTRSPSWPRARPRGSGSGTHDLAIDNRGNARLNAEVEGTDADRQLKFDIKPPGVVVEPGMAGFAKVRVSPVKRFWRGQPKTRPFQLFVRPEGGTPITIDGTLLQESVAAALVPQGADRPHRAADRAGPDLAAAAQADHPDRGQRGGRVAPREPQGGHQRRARRRRAAHDRPRGERRQRRIRAALGRGAVRRGAAAAAPARPPPRRARRAS